MFTTFDKRYSLCIENYGEKKLIVKVMKGGFLVIPVIAKIAGFDSQVKRKPNISRIAKCV